MYRMERAFEMLIAAEDNLKIGQYKTSLNRSYYAIFHVMRAANIIKGFDSSKHSGVIAFFNKEYLKENIIDRKMYPIIKVHFLEKNRIMMISLLQVKRMQKTN